MSQGSGGDRHGVESKHGAEDSPPPKILIGKVPAPALHVMSWNIRREVPEILTRLADRWQQRAPRLRSLLHGEQPSLIGIQETLPAQSEFVQRSLGPMYRAVGHGRGPHGEGESCPLIFDSGRLKLLDWEQNALSDQPTQAGSRSWGNIIPRIVVSGIFLDRATGAQFQAFNTHLDHLSGRSRLNSARAIAHLAAARELPTVVTGDFNADAGSPPLLELLSGGGLVDAWDAAQNRVSEKWGTLNSYREPRLNRPRIDSILLSADTRVSQAGINANRHLGGWGSDHLPVHAVVHFEQGGGGQ